MDENVSNTSDDESSLVMPTEDNDRTFAYSNDHEVAEDFVASNDGIAKEKEQYLIPFIDSRPSKISDDNCLSQDIEPYDAIKQEATKIINYRINKNFKKINKNSTPKKLCIEDRISLNFVKSPTTEEPEDLLNSNEESNDQPLDFSLKSRKRRNSESEESLNESSKVIPFENNEDAWLTNHSAEVHGDELSPERLESKETKEEARKHGEVWSQSVNKEQDYVSDSNLPNNANSFHAWSRSFPDYSQPLHHALFSRMLNRECHDKPFLGQLNNFYNAAYHADFVQRFIHNRLWMVAQAKGLQLPTSRSGLETCFDFKGKDFLANISSNVALQHRKPFSYHPNHLFHSKDEIEKTVPKKMCPAKEEEMSKFSMSSGKATLFNGSVCNKTNGTRKIGSPKEKIILNNQEFKNRPGCLGDFICQLCNERFDNSLGLANHNCSKMAKIRYECPQCDKVFNCPANLASHRRWHRPKQT